MASLPNRMLSRAVLLGTSNFRYLPDLPAVRNNLVDLRTALTDPTHGIFEPDNCEIVDGPETPYAFITSLKHVVRRTDDFLLVYYAGHGLKNDAGDKLYLTVGQTEREALDGSAVPFEWVKDALEDSRARASLLVLDCCYSGMAAGIMSDGAVSNWEIQVRGSAVLASSPRTRTSHSPEGHRHTAFTGKMINLLENGSPIRDEPLTVTSLYRRVSVALTKERFPEPKLALTETSGDLLVRRFAEVRRAAPVPHVDPPTVRNLPPVRQPIGTPPPRLVTQPAAPFPPPAASAPRPPQAELWSKLIVLRTLWAMSALWSIMWGSSLIGVLFADNEQDDSYLRIGLSLAVLTGALLLYFMRRWGHLRALVGPPVLTRFLAGRILLVAGATLCFVIGVAGLFSDSTTNSNTGSAETARTAIVLVGLEGAAGCAYLLRRGQRHRA